MRFILLNIFIVYYVTGFAYGTAYSKSYNKAHSRGRAIGINVPASSVIVKKLAKISKAFKASVQIVHRRQAIHQLWEVKQRYWNLADSDKTLLLPFQNPLVEVILDFDPTTFYKALYLLMDSIIYNKPKGLTIQKKLLVALDNEKHIHYLNTHSKAHSLKTIQHLTQQYKKTKNYGVFLKSDIIKMLGETVYFFGHLSPVVEAKLTAFASSISTDTQIRQESILALLFAEHPYFNASRSWRLSGNFDADLYYLSQLPGVSQELRWGIKNVLKATMFPSPHFSEDFADSKASTHSVSYHQQSLFELGNHRGEESSEFSYVKQQLNDIIEDVKSSVAKHYNKALESIKNISMLVVASENKGSDKEAFFVFRDQLMNLIFENPRRHVVPFDILSTLQEDLELQTVNSQQKVLGMLVVADSDFYTKAKVLRVLGSVHSAHWDIHRTLKYYLSDSDWRIRFEVVGALAKMVSVNWQIKQKIQDLADTDLHQTVRRESAIALLVLNHPSLENALGHYDDPVARDVLLNQLKSPTSNEEVQNEIFQILQKLWPLSAETKSAKKLLYPSRMGTEYIDPVIRVCRTLFR